MSSFDYGNYGAFKRSTAMPGDSRARSLLRRLGFGHRYLKFLKAAPRNEPLIEIGCGDGSFLRELMAQGFLQVQGIEPSTSYKPVIDQRHIVQAFAQDHLGQVASSSLGTVVSLDVFEHIPVQALQEVLTTIHRCLRPGGRLLIRVPNMSSPLGMLNYFGDVSHTTPLNEVSLRQLAFASSFQQVDFHAEPFAYPSRISTLVGILLWWPYRLLTHALLAAFGIRARVHTPNLVCIMTKAAQKLADPG